MGRRFPEWSSGGEMGLVDGKEGGTGREWDSMQSLSEAAVGTGMTLVNS